MFSEEAGVVINVEIRISIIIIRTWFKVSNKSRIADDVGDRASAIID